MSIGEALLPPIAKLFAETILKKWLQSASKNATCQDTVEKVASHLTYVANWSSSIQFPGLGAPQSTDTNSIELGLNGTPRRFKDISNRRSDTSESELLNEYNNFLILGDPGAGKTTTLKRLVRRLILEESISDSEVCQYPVLIRLKEIDVYQDIYSIIADILGFAVEEKQEVRLIEKKIPVRDGKGNAVYMILPRLDAGNNPVRDAQGKIETFVSDKLEERTITEEKVELVKRIDGTPISEFIIGFLDRTQAILLIDGLDELDDRFNQFILKDLCHLGLHLASSKIIVTCRSGLFNVFRSLEGYDILEILPLDSKQIVALASLWIDNPDEFICELDNLPYRDLADRPLLLSQLLLIYIRQESLPILSIEVYETIIDLLLKDWDLDRGIVRNSKYSDFGVNRKKEFLSELSFRLMYKKKKLQFDSNDLVSAYKDIYYKYYLPIEEAEEVASEIESHTGIIVSLGRNKYEFSHLSLHEYLCAHYIVRSPLSTALKSILESHSEPVAIAIALAGDASDWFQNLVVESAIFDVLKVNISSFLKRLIIEKPVFRVDETLGFAIFSVFFTSYIIANEGLKQTYREFFKLRGISESVKKLMDDREAVSISRRKPRSKEIIVSYSLPISSAAGAKFTKSFPTNTKDLKEFFSLFGHQLKASHITKG